MSYDKEFHHNVVKLRKPSVIVSDDAWHGTVSGYNYHKCRCEQCKAARAAYNAGQYKPEYNAGLDDDSPWHGHHHARMRFGCTCDPCRLAHNVYSRALYHRRGCKGLDWRHMVDDDDKHLLPHVDFDALIQ